jgi:predicted transcriptional regulator
MTTALASTQGALNPLKEVKADTILARYLAEESTTQIAKSLGVTRSALNYWLLENCEKEWRSAQVIRAMKRKEDAEDAIDQASDALTLARAREALRAAQWDLERVCRRIYGQDVPVNAGSGVQININLRRTNGDIVDVSPEDISTK